ncbi:hypothetical protein ACHAXS_010246 [Conticribra weissflogii]
MMTRPTNRFGSKPKSSSLFTILGVIALATWALLESNSSIVLYETNNESRDANLHHDPALRALSEAIGNVTLASDIPLQKFLVISQQRSGTRFIASLVDKHSHIRCGHEELFLRVHKIPLERLIEKGNLDDYMEQVLLSLTLLSRLKGENVDDNLSHVGFEVMYDQGVRAFRGDLMDRLKKENFKIIHLIRKNKLLQYISKDSNDKDRDNPVEESHEAHPTDESTVSSLQKIKVDGNVTKMLTYFDMQADENLDVDDLLLAEFGENGYHKVFYEDLNNDNQGEMDRIFDYLGVERQSVKSEFAKIHEGKRGRDYFQEADRNNVEKAIRNSSYAFTLEPDLPGYPGW